MTSEITKIDCPDATFGDFAFRGGYCSSCNQYKHVLEINHSLYRLCGNCLEQGFKLLMKLVGSPKAVI